MSASVSGSSAWSPATAASGAGRARAGSAGPDALPRRLANLADVRGGAACASPSARRCLARPRVRSAHGNLGGAACAAPSYAARRAARLKVAPFDAARARPPACTRAASRRHTMKLNPCISCRPGSLAAPLAAGYRARRRRIAAEAGRLGGQVDLPQGARRLRRRPHRRRPRDLPEGSRRGAGRAQAQPRSTTPARCARTRSIAATASPRRTRPTAWRASKARASRTRRTTTSGSVAGGGILRETTTTTTGVPTVIIVPPRRRPARRADPLGAAAAAARGRPAAAPAAPPLLSSPPFFAPWLPFTSPTSSRPSTGGASAVPRPTASPRAPRCSRSPRSTR